MLEHWTPITSATPELYDVMGCDISEEVLVYKSDSTYDIASVWIVEGNVSWRDNRGFQLKNITHWKIITPI